MKPASASLKFALLTVLHALCISTTASDSVGSKPATGNLLSLTREHRPTAKQKSYGTTVPLQLVGNEWKPITLLKDKSHPTSLKLLIEVEGEQMLLALEKNHSGATHEQPGTRGDV